MKTRGRDAEKLPNEIKLECITVNCLSVKVAIEGLLQNLFEALQTCLRRSIQGDLVSADAFLTSALEKLSRRPQTVDELSEAKSIEVEFSKSTTRLLEQLSCAESKDRLLRSVAGVGVPALTCTKAKWEKFQLTMESFRIIMNEQLEVMKRNTDSRTKTYLTALEKLASRWYHLKPGRELLENGDYEACKAAISMIRERQNEFAELETTRQGLLCSLLSWMRCCTSSPSGFLWADKWCSVDMTAWIAVFMSHEFTPCLKWLRGEALSQEHWLDAFRMLGLPKDTSLVKLNFGDLIRVSKQIVEHSDELKALSQRAQSEVIVREALHELDLWGASATFTLTEYVDTSGCVVNLVKDWKDIVSQVGDNLSLLASLQDSPQFGSFADRAGAWDQRLTDLDHCLSVLQSIQRKWVYLEPILGRGALPKEAGRFAQVDGEFRRLLSSLKADNRVVSLVAGKRGNCLKTQLSTMQDQMTRCQRALNNYLEEKRDIFPRFYFLGDDDLLEILGQATNPSIIQTHLRKLFQGIHRVQFDEQAKDTVCKTITAMCSQDGELVRLQRPIQLTPDVEVWLGRLVSEMRTTLDAMLAQCLAESSTESCRRSHLDPGSYPGQILLLSEAIQFARRTEEALNCGRLSVLKKELQTQLSAYTSVDLNILRKPRETNSEDQCSISSHVLAAKLRALILDIVHSLGVIDQLIDGGAANSRDWLWQRQLRFYAGTKQNTLESKHEGAQPSASAGPLSDPKICMADAVFLYTFEYQGNTPRLVHTPLTDRCYLTLTQAMRMGLGGNPYGPAGTGKTESVKALGNLMGRQVLVFNCDEGIDVRSMGRIFIGIVKCGAWGCFDEFNRLDEAVLSAVSMQIQIIQDGLRSSASHVKLLNRDINLDPNSGLFVTLNPAGRGYGGRQKLPDNLKQLFRPIAMTQPDVNLIAEMILLSEGFRHARLLGHKLTSLFELSRQLLSVQQHYDWGLRALKTVLHSAGELLRTRMHQLAANTESPAEIVDRLEETQMVIRICRTNTLPKLTGADANRFDELLRDVFPEAELHQCPSEDEQSIQLIDTLRNVVRDHQMVLVEAQVRKALEVYEQTRQRIGVVLVGPSGCGKSTALSILRMALARLGRPVKYHVFNPKAMTRAHLLGRVDPDTREWTDGVLTHSARCVVKEEASQPCWIVCDGDIDPEWVESLNSVLDDNRLLTLPNGERIQFGANINFLFETHELINASPATISRMGMVYISEDTMEPKALVEAWLAQQPEDQRENLRMLLDPAFYLCLDWVYRRNDFVVEMSPSAAVFNGLSHLVGVKTPAQLTVGLIRGLGANLTDSSREALALQVYQSTGESPPDPTRPLDVRVDHNCPSRLIPYHPGTGLVLLGPHAKGSAEYSISDILADHALSQAAAAGLASGCPPLVLTADVRRAVDSFRCWLDDPQARQSFLLVGPEGCGKGRLLEYCFASAPRSTQVAMIHCSAQTSPSQVLEKLSQCSITVTSSTTNAAASRVLRPKEGERLILYLRDLNLPKPDKWGSCRLTAFLQQLLTYHGYYDPVSLEFVGTEGIQFVGSFTPVASSAGLGRHPLSCRFASALRLAVITYPDTEQMITIYSCLLQTAAMLHVCKDDLPSASLSRSTSCSQTKTSNQSALVNPARLNTMATIMVHLLGAVKDIFRADEHAHCVFTPHILTAWVTGLLRYELNNSVDALWAAFGQEARRLIRDRLPGEQFRKQFDTVICGLAYNNLSGGPAAGLQGVGKETQLLLKMATGELDKYDDDSSSDYQALENQAAGDFYVTGSGCFTSWGATKPSMMNCCTSPYGCPLGFLALSSVKELVDRALNQLSREQDPNASNFVLFPEFLDLICRVDQALTRPAGSLLLAGRSGIGRRSAVKVVAHLHQLTTHHLRFSRDSDLRQFFTDIKTACQVAGIDAQPTLVVIEEHSITDTLLEIVNSLLACGEAPGLFGPDELETLASNAAGSGGISLREAASEAGHRGPLSAFLANRIRANLHIVLILDIVDKERFSEQVRSNPSLYKHCSIQWLDNWTNSTLLSLPKLFVPSIRESAHGDSLCRALTAMHTSAPHPHMAAPRRYLTLCATYTRIEQSHRSKGESQASRLQAGLTKLKEARRHVNQLKMCAAEQGAQLAEKQSAADKALEQISAAMQGAAEQRTEMEALRNRATTESKNLERRKAAIDAELAEIGPLIEQARAAVGSIRPEALSEMRALRAPPDVIRDILEGVLLLMGIRDTSWVSMRSFLAKRGVQEEILTFDAHRITPELRVSVEKLLSKNQDSFDPKIARRASIAAAPLATWVRANVKYAVVLERIAPLEAEQAQLRISLAEAESALTRLVTDLAGVDAQVAQLRYVFEQHTAEAARLKVELNRAKETLASAEALVGELEDEYTRWNEQVKELATHSAALPPLAMLSSAFITYLSASPEDERQCQLSKWMKQLVEFGMNIPEEFLCQPASFGNTDVTETKIFDIRRFLTTEREQTVWRNEGLPSDRLSGENALVILEGTKESNGTTMCPFIVDPSSRIVNWLKVHFKDQRVETINQQSSNFITTLELSVRFGKLLIVQEVDEIEPILFPLLSRNFGSRGVRSTVTLGDKTLDFHPDFRLILCTRETPSRDGAVRPASAAALVTVVNFVTTPAGLTDRLLELSVNHERPELGQRRQELVRKEEDLKLELATLEDTLLEQLASAQGDILENKDLLQSLNKTKQSSMTIASSLVEFTRLQKELDKERNTFQPLAEAGSRVYFALIDLVRVNWMYQFSLDGFLHLFQKALEAPNEPSTDRTSFLLKRLEALVYAHVSESLFKSDRLAFTMHLVRCLRPEAIAEEEWQLFLGLSPFEAHKEDEAAPHWLNPERTTDVLRLKVNWFVHFELCAWELVGNTEYIVGPFILK
ncbi:unnamed protein product [Dicrocoelium dendriticum]|nr:unnamed protein product [Dicrocoelium dendriticum]